MEKGREAPRTTSGASHTGTSKSQTLDRSTESDPSSLVEDLWDSTEDDNIVRRHVDSLLAQLPSISSPPCRMSFLQQKLTLRSVLGGGPTGHSCCYYAERNGSPVVLKACASSQIILDTDLSIHDSFTPSRNRPNASKTTSGASHTGTSKSQTLDRSTESDPSSLVEDLWDSTEDDNIVRRHVDSLLAQLPSISSPPCRMSFLQQKLTLRSVLGGGPTGHSCCYYAERNGSPVVLKACASSQIILDTDLSIHDSFTPSRNRPNASKSPATSLLLRPTVGNPTGRIFEMPTYYSLPDADLRALANRHRIKVPK
eukprot:gene31127-6264_t